MNEVDGFAELLEKYVEMRAMRLASAAGDPVDPRPRMRALAARHPGALREIDELPMDEIEERIAVLEAGEQPSWAVTLIAYHGWMRVALGIKRAHRPATDPGSVREWLVARYRPRPGEPPLEALDEETIIAILRPPGGRLSRWVLTRIARERGLSLDRVEAEAFRLEITDQTR